MTTEEDFARLERSLTNLTPTPEGIGVIRDLRKRAIELGRFTVTTLEPSRERSLALTHLEEAVMWAVKAIALETGTPSDPVEADNAD